ncbi:reverse transcriptase domain-containing protein [Tanacetum coccineum]
MADDQPMWGNNRVVAPIPGDAIVAVDLGDNFTIKGHHLSMIKDRQFDGRSWADPHKHIAKFVEENERNEMECNKLWRTLPIHHRIATINLWEDPRRKKQTMHPEDIEEDIKEIIMVESLVIGAIVNLTIEMKTETQTLIPPKLGDPKSFLIPCKLAKSVEYLALADLGASINLMPYSLYTSLFGTTLKPTRMSIRLANHTYQYPMGVAENMLVQVSIFVVPIDFVILQIEEDDRVPLILVRPFLHTADAIIRVKNKELNLGIREDRATFHIDKAMQHSHVNDDTCFCIDVIDEITEDELVLLTADDSKPFLN